MWLIHFYYVSLSKSLTLEFLYVSTLYYSTVYFTGRSVDIPDRTLEESCKVDMSPELEAGVPTLDVEGVQGRAPDGVALPDVNTGKPHLNKPEGTLKTQVPGPDTFTEIDLGKPSYGLDLPSSKKKSAKCFSCASNGDRDEPYIKGKSNAGIGLSTPDMTADRKAQDVKLSTGKPDLKLPSRDFDGPDGHIEMKAGRNFDMSGSGPEIRGPDVGDTQKDYGLRGSAPDVDIDVDHGRYGGDASLPTAGVAPKGPGLGPSSAEMNLLSGKKKLGNCLTCTASGKKDEPYRKARKNYGYEFEGHDVDGSIEMKRLSGPSTDASGPDVDISKKRPGAKLDFSDVDAPEGRLSTEISGPNAKLSSGRVKGPSASADVHSPGVDFPSTKKKSGSCFSCVGNGDKDEPYRTNRGKTDFGWNPPEVHGSLKMEKPDALDISGSGTGFSGRGEKRDLGYQVTGPDFNVHGPNKGISTEIPKMAVDTAYPHIKSADVPSGNISAGISGPEIDLSGPRADVPDRDFNIKGPKGDFSGPESDTSRPKAGVSGPEIDLSGPSPDLPKVDINTKGLKGDFSGPKFDVNRPKGGVSRPEMDLSGPSADVSKGDFNVRGPKGDLSGPEYEARRPKIGVNGPEIDLDGPNSDFSNGEFNIRGPKGDSVQPETEFSGPNIDFRGPKAGASFQELNMELTGEPKVSGPGLDASTGNIKEAKVHLDAPSAEIDLPSRKKRMGGNCFSCAGGADKDVPYGKKAVDANVDLKGSDAGVSGPKLDTSRPKVGVSRPGIDYNEPSTDLPKGDFNKKWPKGDVSGPEFDAMRPKAGFSGSEIDLSGPKADVPDRDFNIKGPKGDFSGPEFDAIRPKAGFSGPEIDESGPSADVSKGDFNVRGPKGDFSGPECEARRPKIGVNGPEIDLDGPNSDVSNGEFNMRGPKGDSLRPETEFSGPNIDFRGPKAGAFVKEPNMELPGKPKVSGPDLDVSTGNVKDPNVNLNAPTAELDLPSRKKRMGGNCFSCAGGADKDLPYGKKGVDANVDLKSPNGDFSGPELNASRPKVGGSGPRIDLSGPSTDIFMGGVNITGPKGDFSGPEFDASRHKTGVSEPEIDASGLSADISKADFDVRGPKGDFSGLEVDASRPKPGLPRPHLELSGPSTDISNGDFNIRGPKADFAGPEFDTSYPKSGISGPKVSVGRPSTDFSGPKFDVSGLKADVSVEELKVSGPDPDSSIGKVEDSKVNVNSPSADLDFPSRKKRKSVNCLSCTGGVDKDAPYGKKAMDANVDLEGPNGKNRDGEFELGQPEFDGKFGVKKAGNFDLHGPNIDSEDLAMKANTPDFDLRSNKPNSSFQTPELDVKAGNNGEIDISLPHVTHEKPKLSGTFTGVEDKDIELRGPGLDVDSSRGSADWGISGSSFPDAPSVAINKPSISGGDLDTDAEVLGLRISGSKPSSELDTNALDNNTDVPKSDLRFGISKPDLDTKADQPDLDISAQKPQFGEKEFHIDHSEPEIPTNDFNFDSSLPGIGLGFGGLDKNMRTGEYLDIDINRPDINGYDMDIPKPEIETGDVNLEGSLPELDTSAIGLDNRQLDINVRQPTQEILAPKTLDSPEPNGGWSFQPGGKDYDTNFDWSVNTSTPKQKGSNPAKLELETEPLAVVNDSSLELQSTPTKFPSLDYEEPRNLQRYDEIRPDMELRLLSPKKTDYPEPGFEFENSEGSIDIGKDGIERKPGRMSLVKVEENVTVCSASLEEDEPPAPRKRTLTLEKEVKQKIEVVFPGEESSDTKQKSSSSSSSSSSSESEDNKEKTEKRKKKSRLFKAFRKSSTSSASSKEGETPPSSSEDEKEGKKKPSKGDIAMGITTQIKPKKRKSSGSSSSSDNKTGKKKSVKQKDSKQHKTSTSSTSSSDEDHSKKTSFPTSSEYPSAPVKYNVEYTTLPKQYLVSAKEGGPKKPESSVPTVVSHIRDDKSKHEERKSSTSSSSDESVPKHTTSPKDPQPSMLYKVEYFTNQQKYIIEPHDEFDKPELSAAEVQEDAPKVEFHSVKPEDPKFSFIESKERKSSASSLSSEKGTFDVQEVDLKMESPSTEPKDPSLFFTKANERKSSTSSTSSEESGRLSPNLEVSVQRHETVHHVSTPDRFSMNQVDVPAVTEDPLVIVTRSFKRPVPESDEEGATEHSKVQLNEPLVTLAYHLQYSHNIRMGMEGNDNQVQEQGITPVVRSRSVEYDVPDLSIVLQPEDGHSKDKDKAENRVLADERDRASPTMDIQAHTFETVYEVNIPERPTTDDYELEIQEHSPVVVLRSVKRISPEHDDLDKDTQILTSNADVQLSEPSNDVQLDYPEGWGVSTTDDYHLPRADEEWIVKHAVKKDKPDITSLAGSDEKDRASPTMDIQAHTFETVYEVNIPERPTTDDYELEIQEHSPVVVLRSVKRISPEHDDLDKDTQILTSNADVQLSEPSNDVQLDYPEGWGVSTTDDYHLPRADEEWIVKHAVKKDKPDITSLAGSDEKDRASPTMDIQAHTFETVYEVNIPERPTTDDYELEIQEHSPVVVLRSVKRISPEHDDLDKDTQILTSNADVQLSEPSNDVQLDYPEGWGVSTTDDYHLPRADEEWIVKHAVKKDKPDITSLAGSDEKDRASPTMDIQAHTFETVYEVNIPERPTTDDYELEIQEHSPVVVLRSVKRISPEHDDLQEDTQILTSNADVQLSEPSNDVELDYPEGWGVSTTDDYHLPRADEEWIVKHAVKKDKPDITSLAGSLDFPENKNQPKAEPNQDKDASVKSLREASSPRRNSNSRLWDLMQGYLIERPIVDDDDDEDSKQDPEKTTEVKNEGDSKPEKPERSVYNFTIQPVKFDTVDVQVQANDSKEPAKKLTTSFTQVEVDVPKETPPVSQFHIIAVKPDVKEQHTELETAPVPKVESVIPKATSSVSQFEPVAIQLDVGSKQPIVKEPRSSWRKEASLPSDADDNESDPWMRHYSKGLYQRGHHQPSTSKFTEKESTVPERPGLSLSKVPHVKGVRTSSEHQRERPRYSIEGRARIEPASYPSIKNSSQTGTSRQESSNRPSVSSLRSFWDK